MLVELGPFQRWLMRAEEEPESFETFLGHSDHLFAMVFSVPEATIAVMSNMATELAEKALCNVVIIAKQLN